MEPLSGRSTRPRTRDGAAPGAVAAPPGRVSPFVSRLERFATVDSTQPIVRGWLESGTPEVAVAVADEQTAGRGRQGRGWTAPPGVALLSSVGFRPSGLLLRHAWRLAATCALAMLDAAEDAGGLRDGSLSLKWPNDNADWSASGFPTELAGSMTSLRELSGGRPIDRDALLEAYLARLEARYEALGMDRFDSGGWSTRQRTTGRHVEVDIGPDAARIRGVATGIAPDSGALLVEVDGGTRVIESGEVVRCRIVELPVRR
jgi:BirA family transcriptional regulator, biotin operon repressor / biotin---[acetyl-CoA-carboxylase] ligase